MSVLGSLRNPIIDMIRVLTFIIPNVHNRLETSKSIFSQLNAGFPTAIVTGLIHRGKVWAGNIHFWSNKRCLKWPEPGNIKCHVIWEFVFSTISCTIYLIFITSFGWFSCEYNKNSLVHGVQKICLHFVFGCTLIQKRGVKKSMSEMDKYGHWHRWVEVGIDT